MKKKIIFLTVLFCVYQITYGQDTSGNQIFTDPRDGQIYPTLMIGNQCWMTKNLNYGEIVPNMNQSNNGIVEKTCYKNDPENCKQYGALYTWNEAMNYTMSKDICPEGWRIPTLEDWQTLNNYLGVDSTGQKMKVTRNDNPAWDGTNESGFSALPSGNAYRDSFGRLTQHTYYWSSSTSDSNPRYAWFSHLDNHWAPYKYTILHIGDYFLKENGFSVRCIKDDK